MFQDKTVQEVSEAILADIQQKVGFKINMNKLMWRLCEQAKHIIGNSDKEYHDLAVLYHIADADNRAYLLVNTEIDFDVTSYDFLVNTIHFGYNLPVIIHDQEIIDIMTKLVYTHARNIGYDHFVPKDEANPEDIDMDSEEVNITLVSARRITNDVLVNNESVGYRRRINDAKHRREVMEQKESTARRLKENKLSNAAIAKQMGISESSVRLLLDPFDKDDILVNTEAANVRRRINDAKHRKELIEKVQWYTLYGLGAVLLLSIGLIIYTYIFNR